MPATHSDETKATALAIYERSGPGAAADQTGVTQRTVTRWAKAAGLSFDPTKKAAAPDLMLSLSEYRAETALRLYREANALLDQLHEPHIERKAMTVSHGAHKGQEVEIVDIELDKPRYSDQRQIMTAVGIALDKAHHLSGGAADSPGIPAREVIAMLDELIGTVAPSADGREAATAEIVRHLRRVK